MGAVLIDNWTLHDITYHQHAFNYNKAKYKARYGENRFADLENLLMAILLWDEIYFWDNNTTDYWKCESQLMQVLPSLMELDLSPELELEVESLTGTDLIVDGAQRYLLIAQKSGIDYLPKQVRYQYLTSEDCFNYRAKNAVLQKQLTEKVEKSLREFYDELAKKMGNMQLQFRFPLLLDYVRSQMEEIGDEEIDDKEIGYYRYIEAALHMRETAPLCEMRSWIDNLHLYIDEGNWIEVRHSMDHVEDIVSMIKAPLAKDVTLQIGPQPSISANISLDRLKGSHKTQLTFLHDIIEFGLKKRPEC